MGVGWLSMAALWILVVLGIINVVKLISGGTGREKTKATATDILKTRYAKGEITKEEFERMKEDIRKD